MGAGGGGLPGAARLARGRAGGGGWREAQGLLGLLDYPEQGAGSAGEGEGKGAAGGIPEDATVLS